jgi:hypothetical protein
MHLNIENIQDRLEKKHTQQPWMMPDETMHELHYPKNCTMTNKERKRM